MKKLNKICKACGCKGKNETPKPTPTPEPIKTN